MPRTQFLRFPFSSTDQESIDPGTLSLQVDDVPYSGTPGAGAPYPQSLRIRFRRKNNVTTPIQIRPLFPGPLAFVRDDTAAPIPRPSEVTDAGNAYDAWPTRGTLMVTLHSQEIQKHLRTLAPGLEVPRYVWYSGVRLSREFLFTGLREQLKKNIVEGRPPIATTRADWWKHAIPAFLSGKPVVALQPKNDPDDDQAIRASMPVLEAVNGEYTLVIGLGTLAGTPQDGEPERLGTVLPGVDENDPANPRFAIVPARHVLRLWRASMVDGTGDVPDAVLREWPHAPRYFPVRFTRTWKPVRNTSVHFPRQRVRVTSAGGAVVAEQRLAANGMFYLTQTPPAPLPPDPGNISPPSGMQLTVEGGMRWLDGSQPECWRIPGGTAPIPLSFAGGAVPHVVLRVTMSQAMIPDDYFPSGDWFGCTYLSVRRTVRALIDNRIAGGRLNFDPTRTGSQTRQLINQALGGNLAAIVAYNAPNPAGSPDLATEFIPILRKFFPGDAPPVEGCTPAPTADLSRGLVIYTIWQSLPDAWYQANQKCYYPDEIVMRGSTGAMYYAGIGGILNNLAPADLATDPVVQRRLAQSIRDGNLQPGTLLQLWRNAADVERARTRTERVVTSGHSPVFLRYEYNDEDEIIGIRYIDQGGGTGNSVYFGDDGMLGGPPIWFANTWNE